MVFQTGSKDLTTCPGWPNAEEEKGGRKRYVGRTELGERVKEETQGKITKRGREKRRKKEKRRELGEE